MSELSRLYIQYCLGNFFPMGEEFLMWRVLSNKSPSFQWCGNKNCGHICKAKKDVEWFRIGCVEIPVLRCWGWARWTLCCSLATLQFYYSHAHSVMGSYFERTPPYEALHAWKSFYNLIPGMQNFLLNTQLSSSSPSLPANSLEPWLWGLGAGNPSTRSILLTHSEVMLLPLPATFVDPAIFLSTWMVPLNINVNMRHFTVLLPIAVSQQVRSKALHQNFSSLLPPGPTWKRCKLLGPASHEIMLRGRTSLSVWEMVLFNNVQKKGCALERCNQSLSRTFQTQHHSRMWHRLPSIRKCLFP